MVEVTDNAIKLTKGDTGNFTLNVTQGESQYDFSNDTVKFAVKRNFNDSTYLVEKTVGSDGTFVIEPADTVDLTPGVYWYDVRVKTADGDIYTVIAAQQFIIGPAVINGTGV